MKINCQSVFFLSRTFASRLDRSRTPSKVDYSNLDLPEIPSELFDRSRTPSKVDYSNLDLPEIPSELFDRSRTPSKVDYSNLELPEIPSELFDRSDLDTTTKLNIDYNNLSTLSASMVRFSRLESLNFNKNKAEIELGEAICSVQTLKFLNMADRNVTKISDDIGKLTNLKWLGLSGNPLIKSIPSSIKGCISLGSLNLAGTGLTEFPSEIEGMHWLSVLHLDNTKIEEIPSLIKTLAGLKYLYLSRLDNLKTLPTEIAYLANLNYLYLTDSGIETLPKEIAYLSRLNLVNLSGTKLKRLPREILNLPKHCIIYLENILQFEDTDDENNLGRISLEWVHGPKFVFSSRKRLNSAVNPNTSVTASE